MLVSFNVHGWLRRSCKKKLPQGGTVGSWYLSCQPVHVSGKLNLLFFLLIPIDFAHRQWLFPRWQHLESASSRCSCLNWLWRSDRITESSVFKGPVYNISTGSIGMEWKTNTYCMYFFCCCCFTHYVILVLNLSLEWNDWITLNLNLIIIAPFWPQQEHCQQPLLQSGCPV